MHSKEQGTMCDFKQETLVFTNVFKRGVVQHLMMLLLWLNKFLKLRPTLWNKATPPNQTEGHINEG
jgi:hypothetical protein